MAASLFVPALDGGAAPLAQTLFIPELDGDTFTYAELEDYRWARMEHDAENAWLRAAETNDQYTWEEEEDRRRAAFWGGI
jgi:hypothetical protein